MSRDKQIEENNSCCNSCIHRFVCFQCDDDTLVCSQYKDEGDYRKASDVAREIFEKIFTECVDYYGYIVQPKLADLKKKYESEGEE